MFKAFPTEGGIISPLIVKIPGKNANAGGTNHALFHVRDIMPTLLDLAEVSYSDKFNGRRVRSMQGQSLLDFFKGKATAPFADAGKIGYELFGMKAFLDGHWKILWMPKPFGGGDWELFNLKDDPGELNDLSTQQSTKRQNMIAQWEKYKLENGVLDISMELSGNK
jgi:arylsulfatase